MTISKQPISVLQERLAFQSDHILKRLLLFGIELQNCFLVLQNTLLLLTFGQLGVSLLKLCQSVRYLTVILNKTRYERYSELWVLPMMKYGLEFPLYLTSPMFSGPSIKSKIFAALLSIQNKFQTKQEWICFTNYYAMIQHKEFQLSKLSSTSILRISYSQQQKLNEFKYHLLCLSYNVQ